MDNKDLNAVAIKLPAFWTTQPNVWFTQAEAQFHIKNVTQDSTKYYYVVSALDQSTASRIIHVLSNPPADGKYENLKKKLLETFGLTRRDRANKLLHMSGLGDRKPSELMDEMLSLLDGHTFCLLAEQIFLEQLPADIRLQLANSDFTDPRNVALQADVLWLAKQQSASSIQQVSIRKPVARQRPSNGQDLCYYHAKFGEKARKCFSPCKHQENETAGRQQHL